ncbi:MAG: ECF transporter S component, partial [Firmicutes bacterium]|nr:ECF transporter S component [Candidatus Colimorpha enterica]
IVVGAALHGPYAGAVLGLVFAAVAIYGEAMGGMFWAISIPGTIAICTVKGVCCGAAAGLVYKLFEKKDRTAAAFAAAVTCPIVNTGLFLVGCFTLFSSALDGWALAAGYATVIKFILVGIICTNFIPELLINVLLSPAIVTIIKNARKAH